MTLMKSLLLGSAAALVTVAAAQAADLPTRKGAPAAEYVKICHVTANGTPITGFVLPGSDTCFKISGAVYALYSMGSVTNEYTYVSSKTAGNNVYNTVEAAKDRSDIGLSVRGQVNFEAVNNTALGPLYSTVQVQGNYGVGGIGGDNGSGLGGVGGATNSFRLDDAYINVAGITAGLHGSFFDYLTGISYWDDLISTDHTGGHGIPLLAYTASFGGGISLTLSVEQPGIVAGGGALGTTLVASPAINGPGGTTNQLGMAGVRAPDLVAALDVKQGWGNAHLAGVAHNVNQDFERLPVLGHCLEPVDRPVGLGRHRRRDRQSAYARRGQRRQGAGRLDPRGDRVFRSDQPGLQRQHLQRQRRRRSVGRRVLRRRTASRSRPLGRSRARSTSPSARPWSCRRSCPMVR